MTYMRYVAWTAALRTHRGVSNAGGANYVSLPVTSSAAVHAPAVSRRLSIWFIRKEHCLSRGANYERTAVRR
jgi:hypothetical protein